MLHFVCEFRGSIFEFKMDSHLRGNDSGVRIMFDVVQQSLFISLPKKHKLHLRRIFKNESGPPVFMLHGAVENGKIFYSEKNKGLASYLAHHGFDVFVADLRGRGLSEPAIKKGAIHGQTESITEDIPAFINEIKKIKGDVPQIWMGHSWGGVLALSCLARHPQYIPLVSHMVFFGTKRKITVFNFSKLVLIDLYWNTTARLIARLCGYLPSGKLGLGSDSETIYSLEHGVIWVKSNDWIDPIDGFNYREAIMKVKLPPALHITGTRDFALGHPTDVELFMKESGNQKAEFKIIGKKFGNKHDYNHVSLLTHSDAADDHFKMILEWVKK